MALHVTIAGSNLLSELRKCVFCCTRAAMYGEQYTLHSNLEHRQWTLNYDANNMNSHAYQEVFEAILRL